MLLVLRAGVGNTGHHGESGQTLASPRILGACRSGGGLDGTQETNPQQDGPKTFHKCKMEKKVQNSY